MGLADTPSHRAKHPQRDPVQDISSVELLKEIQRDREREIRRRIADRFYDRDDIVRETARRILESGDLPSDD